MKKVFSFLFAALMALTVLSCKKETPDEPTPQDPILGTRWVSEFSSQVGAWDCSFCCLKDHRTVWTQLTQGLVSDLIPGGYVLEGTYTLSDPAADGTYTVDSVQYEKTELIQSANIRFSAGKTTGTLVISVYADGAALPVTDYAGAEDAVALQTDRITCYLFTQAGHTVIDFSDGQTVYSVVMNADRETAAAFAQTIQ